MFTRILLSVSITLTLLSAAPDIGQVKQAIYQNPSLLDTPQIKKMMKEKGISAQEARERLNILNTGSSKIGNDKNSTLLNKMDKNSTIFNNIDTNMSIKDFNISKKDIKSEEDSEVFKRTNPFTYKENKEILENLDKKQQFLSQKKLSRYSMNFFANKNTIDSSSLPTPDNYVISSGDILDIHVYGDRNENFTLEVKNDGNIEIPYIGPIQIGGMTFSEAKRHLKNSLGNNFQMSSFNININKYSTIQVTLIGDVKAPGIYNLSSFSSVKDLLVASNGIQESGSIRDIVIKRNSKILAHIDFYDLLFKGEEFSSYLLKHGDIIMINRAKKLVSVDGLVNHSAIFELKDGENLDKVLEYAGGIKANGSATNIKIKRHAQNSRIETYELNYKEAKGFSLHNGDSVYVYPLDYSAQNSVNIYGNIIRPGSYNLTKESTLNELLGNALKDGKHKFFLPQTYFEYGVVKSYKDDLTCSVVSFNLSSVINNTQKVTLKAKDEIYIYAIHDIFNGLFVTTIGNALKNPGKINYFEGMSIRDAINASGVNAFLLDDKVRVTTFNTENFMPLTSFYSMEKAGDTKLHPYDEIEVYDYYATHELTPVHIKGEVINPTSTFYDENMTLEKLVNVAGGFTQKAFKNKAEIVRYALDENGERVKNIVSLNLTKQKLSDVKLQAFDEVSIFKIPRWSEKKSITLAGNVKFPGVYTIEDGERLSDVLKRAGGFTDYAFIDGAVFTRESVKANQIEQYNNSLHKIKRELAIYNAMPANAKKNSGVSESSLSKLNEVITEAEKYQPIGRVSIKLSKDIKEIENSSYNLVLQDKDTITIPGQIDTITVFGEVFNPTSFVYDSSKDATKYIELASGLTRAADTDGIYTIHADGTSEPVSRSWFSNNKNLIKKGDTIIVPILIKENNTLDIWDSVSKILASFAITAAALNSLNITN